MSQTTATEMLMMPQSQKTSTLNVHNFIGNNTASNDTSELPAQLY